MSYKEIKEKYEKTLAKFGIKGRIESVTGSEFPIQEIKEGDDEITIYLNIEEIEEKEYEDYVAHNVRKVLLPRLTLETKRLIIRRVRKEDADAIFLDASDAYSCAMDSGEEPYTEMNEAFWNFVDELIQRETQYSIVLKETKEVVGGVRLMDDDSRQVEAMEVGYGIYPGYRRKGYAYEAVSALLSLVQKELHLDLVLAGAIKENEPSMALLQKLGFEREGFMRKGFWSAKQGPIDMERYYRDRI